MWEPAGPSTLLRRRHIVHRVVASATALGLMALLLATGAVASSGAKGSSCSNPYRVHMAKTFGHVEGNGKRGEMLGDTAYIKVRERDRDIDFEHGYIEGSWVPRVKGLHLCEARLTFNWRKPFVSHEWHASFVKIFAKPGAGLILSYVVTAAY